MAGEFEEGLQGLDVPDATNLSDIGLDTEESPLSSVNEPAQPEQAVTHLPYQAIGHKIEAERDGQGNLIVLPDEGRGEAIKLKGGARLYPDKHIEYNWGNKTYATTSLFGKPQDVTGSTKSPVIKQDPVTGQWLDFSDPANVKKIETPEANQGKEVTMDDVAKMNPSDRIKAEKYAFGRLAPSRFGVGRDKEFNRLSPYIFAINPGYDQKNFIPMQNTLTQYASQRQTDPGGQIRSFNTAMTHMGTLDDLATKMENSWSPNYNSVSQWLGTKAGQPYKKQYDFTANIVATEMARAYKNGVPDQGDINRQREYLDSASSPAQFRSIMRESAPNLVGGALENLDSGYEKTIGKPLPDKSLVYPSARNALVKMGVTHFAGRDLTKYGENAGSVSSGDASPGQSSGQIHIKSPDGKTDGWTDASKVESAKKQGWTVIP